MSATDNNENSASIASAGDASAIEHLRQSIGSGEHWFTALLEAISLWSSPEETYHGRTYRYLINGEAFDWLLLAERLCEEVNDLLPDDEKKALLLHGRPPIDIGMDTFKEHVGDIKYHQYLNYFYGIIVEDALLAVVQEEVRKERRSSGYTEENDSDKEAFLRIYGDTRTDLLAKFRKERRYPRRRSISLTELKEFTYWLFNYRLKHSEKARVASDTVS